MDNGLGIWIPMSECPNEGDFRNMCKGGERPKARKVLSVENFFADLDEMCSSALI